ncbi:MAG TPA: phosphoribosylanthranilate isomerase [Magnetospirillaceae bacterium]|jgi:phosphoribosylanthranilate isomerase
MSGVLVKICGLTDPKAVAAAVEGGADLVGVVFFAKSPRYVTPERAAELLADVPRKIKRVGLFVDADDRLLDQVLTRVRLDMLQLHSKETPARVEAVRAAWGLPVMKALGISTAADLDAAKPYLEVADRLMFDAKPPAGATRPGGNAVAFDWTLLAGKKWKLPWMLAGGLTARNVAQAIKRSGAKAVDVSSGVEKAPGVKDPAKIKRFIAAAKGL